MQKSLKLAVALSLAASSFASTAQAELLVGLTTDNQIGVFDSGSNLSTISYVSIAGLAENESLVGIDLRPSNNTLYGISNMNNLYTVDAYTGAASFAFSLSTPIISASNGYGVDFNPVADAGSGASLRVVSTAGDNYAVNANTGAVTTATSIAAGFSGVAYSNSNPLQAGAPASTALYYLDSTNDTLSVATGAFNAPTINLVGMIGVDILRANGLELFGNGSLFAAVNTDDGTFDSKLLLINVVNGSSQLLGSFNGTLNGLAAAPSAVPVPAALPLMASALGLFGVSRRKVLAAKK
ncbi:MAG TPA: DUF4394 domain-containing protein [Methylophilus sp.]